MQLTEEDIKKYQAIYKQYYGKEISREQAYEDGVSLVRLMDLIYTPIRKADLKRLEEKRKKIK